VDPLKQEVRRQDLWATHLGSELGGQGYGQLKLALLNEVLGRSQWAPIVFGCQAPDTGNAEIIAHYGTPEQKERHLQPLLDGEMFSCYSMTEPHAGADPTMFKTRAVKDGDEWVINGWKYFKRVRKDVATAKVVMPTVLHDIAWRAMQVHGALGTTNEMPFFGMIHGAGVMGLADGPTEVHKVTVARQVLRDYKPSDDVWPSEWIPRKLEAAKARFAEYLEHEVGNL
jgi:acyl-CoA dehydrogenase